MAPKKKEVQKMSLGSFLTDEKLGSWADEMEDMPVYSRTGYGNSERKTYNSTSNAYGGGIASGYSVREEIPLPDKPPYTVHLGNLSFDATIDDVQDLFTGCDCTSVRIIEDKIDMKPKGFGYAEFGTREGVLKALALQGTSFQGRNIRISVADPPKDRDRPDRPEFGDWSRKGPLADLPTRSGMGDRRASDRGDMGERRERFPEGDGKTRDFSNWERKGPLSPLAQPERQNSSREGGRPGSREGAFPDRRNSPAAWGEGRPPQDDGARPPRREFQERPERPVIERAPTAAEQDSQWRTKMRPDAPVPASAPTAAPSSAASSAGDAPPSPSIVNAPMGRPRLNLTKRTVSQAVDSPIASDSGDAKASPFGAARPIDTAAKEKEIEEKRLAAIAEKKEADDKAREEKRIAKEAADADKAAQEARDAETKAAENTTVEQTVEAENANGEIVDDKAVKPKEILRDVKPVPAAEGGAWRRASNGPPPPPRSDVPRGPRGDGSTRGEGLPRGSRNDSNRGARNEGHRGGHRGPRPNGDRSASYQQQQQQAHASQQAPAAAAPIDPEAAKLEEDGWSTVSKPSKNKRGGQAARAIAS